MSLSLVAVGHLILWGVIATVAMTAIMQASQGFGWSRLSLPFLVGTFFTANRDHATIVGLAVYLAGGVLFAVLYWFLFASIALHTWWFGALVGLVHGIFLLVVALPLLPFIHPRMASEYHGASVRRQLEPPGFMALNYGYGTPVSTLLGQIAYGTVLGGFVELRQAAA
jgi:hypothetical protein